MDMTASYPSQGLHHFLEVHEQTIKLKLPAIKAARSDEELKSLLLELAQKVFQVWSATFRWNEASTSSLSSWQHIPKHISTVQHASPKISTASVFPNLERGNQNNHPGTVGKFPTDHTSIITNPQNVPQSTPYPVSNINPNPQGPMVVSNGFGLGGALAAEFSTFPQNGYPTNIPRMEGDEWLDDMVQIQFYASNFDMGGTSPQGMPRMPPQWGDHYPPPNFDRYGGVP